MFNMGMIGFEEERAIMRSGRVCKSISLNCFCNQISANLLNRARNAVASLFGGGYDGLVPSYALA